VIEARHAGVPLIVLTADRPPELREVGAGQTIDQLKLYGDAVKWFFEVGVDEATPERMRWIRALACRVWFAARDGRPGAVHLNFPLREPLVPDGPLPEEPGGGGRDGGGPWVQVERPAPSSRTPSTHRFERTVFVIGTGAGRGVGERLARFAERARVPVFADPMSGARRGGAAIAHYDLLLRDPHLITALQPQVVCRIGELPTSKPLRVWLAGLRQPETFQVAFSEEGTWPDPDSGVFDRTVTPLGALMDRVERDEVVPDQSDWLERWRAADAAAADAIAATLAPAGLSEPLVAATLGGTLPADATLFVASSMPVRDVEEFFPVRPDAPLVLSNRGANGIDGTVSAALGAAAAAPEEAGPTVLLIGDVALAYDLGGLLAGCRHGLALTIVLLNNDGGGIFHFLPVASQHDAFEEHVATPHGLDFAHAAALYGCEIERPHDLGAFAGALRRALQARTTTIIEVRTDRAENLALHRRVAEAVIAARPAHGVA
jgi:2-succinyl-5-enolpyruvyl-6-hydroxy-3-cyclohexene-1-carboxylate synthase